MTVDWISALGAWFVLVIVIEYAVGWLVPVSLRSWHGGVVFGAFAALLAGAIVAIGLATQISETRPNPTGDSHE